MISLSWDLQQYVDRKNKLDTVTIRSPDINKCADCWRETVGFYTWTEASFSTWNARTLCAQHMRLAERIQQQGYRNIDIPVAGPCSFHGARATEQRIAIEGPGQNQSNYNLCNPCHTLVKTIKQLLGDQHWKFKLMTVDELYSTWAIVKRDRDV